MLNLSIDTSKSAKSFNVYLTDKCNLTCPYCYHPCNINQPDLFNKKYTDEYIRAKAIEYIVNDIAKKEHERYKVIINGGEIGLLPPSVCFYFVRDLKIKLVSDSRTRGIPVEFGCATNLCYKISNWHLRLFRFLDFVSLSYDFNIRLNNENKQKLWFSNVERLRKSNIYMSLLILLVKPIKDKDPTELFDWVRSLGINNIDLWPLYDNHTPYFHLYRLTNKEANEWLFKAFLAYEQYPHPEFKIETFECQLQGLLDNHYYEYSRNCVKNEVDIHTNGTVGSCSIVFNTDHNSVIPILQLKDSPFYNKYREMEHSSRDCCKACTYFKACRGRCWKLYWDGTDCPTPKKIFEYVSEKYL